MMETLQDDANSILQEKGYKKHCHALDAFLKVVETNNNIVIRKIHIYKWSGLFLLTSIPLISALLSVSVGLKDSASTWLETTILSFSLPLSLLLTIVTILSSIFRPSERFRNACLIGIQIDAFKIEILGAIEQMDVVNENTLLNLVDTKHNEFQKYQEELIGMFMPMEMSAQQGVRADPKKRHR